MPGRQSQLRGGLPVQVLQLSTTAQTSSLQTLGKLLRFTRIQESLCTLMQNQGRIGYDSFSITPHNCVISKWRRAFRWPAYATPMIDLYAINWQRWLHLSSRCFHFCYKIFLWNTAWNIFPVNKAIQNSHMHCGYLGEWDAQTGQ